VGGGGPDLEREVIPLVLPLQDAATRPAGTTGLEVHAGLSLVSIDVPALPVFPALTLGVAVEHGLTDRLDLGARYTTWLGFDHRLGPELQLGLVQQQRWALGLRAHPWLRLAGTAQGTLSYGGDLSTASALVCTWRPGKLALTAEAGATVQWLLFERLQGQSYTDSRPWLATGDAALELAWADPRAQALALRLELGIPRAPADPLTVLGVRPRLVVAGHFGL
jgi:hypothetical protein